MSYLSSEYGFLYYFNVVLSMGLGSFIICIRDQYSAENWRRDPH